MHCLAHHRYSDAMDIQEKIRPLAMVLGHNLGRPNFQYLYVRPKPHSHFRPTLIQVLESDLTFVTV